MTNIVESFRFWDEDDYRNKIFSTTVILAGKRDSRRHAFSARMSWWQEQIIKCKKFNYFAISEEGLTSFSINNRSNFFGVKIKSKM